MASFSPDIFVEKAVRAIDDLHATIKEFNRVAGRQAAWMIGLTIAIGVLTVVLVVLTGMLVYKEFRPEHQAPAPTAPATPQAHP